MLDEWSAWPPMENFSSLAECLARLPLECPEGPFLECDASVLVASAWLALVGCLACPLVECFALLPMGRLA